MISNLQWDLQYPPRRLRSKVRLLSFQPNYTVYCPIGPLGQRNRNHDDDEDYEREIHLLHECFELLVWDAHDCIHSLEPSRRFCDPPSTWSLGCLATKPSAIPWIVLETLDPRDGFHDHARCER